MKKCYLDSNVLIAFKDEKSCFYKQAQEIIRELIRQSFKLYCSSLTLDEFLFQIKHSFHKREEYSSLFKEILNLPDLYLVNPPIEKRKHLKVLNIMEKFNLRPRDAYHLLTIKENKIVYFVTFDKDFDELFKAGEIKKFL